jgi:DEAD/DEAH box helicase domain-containing protein
LPIGKPARPFGAPDSDAEDDEEATGGEGDNAATEEAERALSPETDEKKRVKLQKGTNASCPNKFRSTY